MGLSIYDEQSRDLLETLKKRKDLLGLDEMLERLERFVKFTNEKTYPPTSIEKRDENIIVIYMALAGFKRNQLNIVLVDSEIIVTGTKDDLIEKKNFIQQGIAFRSFEKKFFLGVDVEILSAKYVDGMLEITAKLPIKHIREDKKNIEIYSEEGGYEK